MGSTNQPLARNVQFEAVTFPDLDEQKQSPETRNRHAKRLSLLEPNPQLISRKLFSRDQTQAINCHEGHGSKDSTSACPYESEYVQRACCLLDSIHDPRLVLSCPRRPECRHHDEHGLYRSAQRDDQMPSRGQDWRSTDGSDGAGHLRRWKIPQEGSTSNAQSGPAWWDASQIYGYDETSFKRVKKTLTTQEAFDAAARRRAGGEKERKAGSKAICLCSMSQTEHT